VTSIRIDTPRLILRSPLIADAAAINAAIHASANELQPWMPWATPLPTLEQTTANLAEAIAATERDAEFRLLLTLHDGTLVGSSGLHDIDWRLPRGEIGYWIDSRHAGRGYASEATAALTAYARDVMGLRRIAIIVSDSNPRSWRIPERLGYALEGVLHEHRINPDGRRDHTRIYACITPDAQGQEPWAGLQRQALMPTQPRNSSQPALLHYDPSLDVAIDPQRRLQRHPAMPEACVLSFFQDAITTRVAEDHGIHIYSLRSEIGHHPIVVLGHGSDAVALVHPGVGAPLAAGILEELIALGARRFIVCGGAGALRHDQVCGHLVLPEQALRDEGTSYHYLPAQRPARPGAKALSIMRQVLDDHRLPYERGATWTTDAMYRETRPRIAQRQAEGCLTVEMEAAALFAVAEHRQVELACLLYCGDMVAGETWDERDWHRQSGTRARLLDLALQAARHPGWTAGSP
jgi:RimJ/RimL family protein N-acetyltransferase/uridine phosphorylase